MIPSSHRTPKNKAIAEVLAMIADAHPESATSCESNESLWENATEFCAALGCRAQPAIPYGHRENRCKTRTENDGKQYTTGAQH